MERRVTGGKIQASVDSTFTEPETFYTIEDLFYPDLIPVDTTGKYRYWRYFSPPDSWGSVAEVQFFHPYDTLPAKGKIIGTPAGWGKEMIHAFDGDWLISYDSHMPHDSWVGLDFEKPVQIESVRIVPRTDDNIIHYGDEYELLYWKKNKWQSLGKIVARDKVLHFADVPENVLLLLRNHTRGSDERIFTYENDKQIWWYEHKKRAALPDKDSSLNIVTP